ncbi:UBX domain-containing protein [Sporobolomyces salmoneus]|uniref:UBX domain-containing protein n=1 Tax=Sporobolomyces salmoneus TaxID=183962 RepID=UPI003174F2C1
MTKLSLPLPPPTRPPNRFSSGGGGMPPTHLSPTQRDTLTQFEAITQRNDERSSLELLDRAGWNLENAISQVYDGTPQNSSTSYPPESSSAQATMNESLLPSSSTTSSSNRRTRTRTTTTTTGGLGTGVVGLYYLRQALVVPVQILSWPLSLVYNLSILVLGFVARLLGFRLSTSTFHPRNPFSPDSSSHSGGPSSRSSRHRTILSPSAASQKWVDSVQRLVSLSSTSSSTGLEIGSSQGLSRRRGAANGEDGVELPDFYIGSYESALRKARDELRVLMVILTCEENERDEEFKLSVLTNSELVKSLKEENVIVWGGDVKERDAYQVGRTLSYTSLPFLAFIALQPTTSPSGPTSSSSSSSSAPRLSLISRLEPTSSLPSLSASTLHTHLHSSVLPKTHPYLSRLQSEKERRERDRLTREAEERRVSEVARRDEERILGIRRATEIKRREEEKRMERLERERLEEEERERRRKLERSWRRGKRREFEQKGETEGDGVRVVVRLGNGKRCLRKFAKEEEVLRVYEWVECELGREDDEQLDDEDPEEEVDELGEDFVQLFAFKLATSFPRQIIPLPSTLFQPTNNRRKSMSSSSNGRDSFESIDGGEGEEKVKTVGQVFEGMGKDVSLVVDGLEERRRMSMSSRGDDSEEEEEEEESEQEEEED